MSGWMETQPFGNRRRAGLPGKLEIYHRADGSEAWYGCIRDPTGKRKHRKLGERTGPRAISRLEAERRLLALGGRALPTPPRPVADPLGDAYAALRRCIQRLDQAHSAAEGRDARRAISEALSAAHMTEDAVVRVRQA